MKIGLVALATFACTLPASAFAAGNPFAQDQAILDLKGLDLASAQGQQRLAIRVDQAASAVCGERLSGVHLAAEAKAQACRASVIADVRAQIESRLASASQPVRLASIR